MSDKIDIESILYKAGFPDAQIREGGRKVVHAIVLGQKLRAALADAGVDVEERWLIEQLVGAAGRQMLAECISELHEKMDLIIHSAANIIVDGKGS